MEPHAFVDALQVAGGAYGRGNAVPHVVVIGAGFTGLSAAYELAARGIRVSILEADAYPGGLAGSFDTSGTRLEKFYHHWFTSDAAALALIDDLNLRSSVQMHDSATGVYYNSSILRLSSPLDLLRFRALSVVDRLRLGAFVLAARRIDDWRQLDSLTACEWVAQSCGSAVFSVVWEPLLRGKFGRHAESISAVWLWNKLRLRGGSRNAKGSERLLYLDGGFATLVDALVARIQSLDGNLRCSSAVTRIIVENDRACAVMAEGERIDCDGVLLTTALPQAADLLTGHVSASYEARLRKIEYLANLCLVLRLDRPLSSYYWLNVNDTSFPFVGVIEHTNFASPNDYGGDSIVYLSRYLPSDDPVYAYDDEAYAAYAYPHLKRMLPSFEETHVRGYEVWRARYAQPIVECGYANLIPQENTPIANVHLCSMAQIYPQDRGTNYAIERGRAVGKKLAAAYGMTPA